MELQIRNHREHQRSDEEFAATLEVCLEYLLNEVEQHDFQSTKYFINLAKQSIKDDL